MPVEQGVSIGSASTSGQVRNVVASSTISGAAASTLMQVVTLADQSGNLLDLSIAKRLDSIIGLLADIRREQMIENELWAQYFGLQFPNSPAPRLDEEYRKDPAYTIAPDQIQ